MKPTATVLFTLDALVSVIFAAQERVQALRALRGFLEQAEEIWTAATRLTGRTPLFLTCDLVDVALKSAREDVFIGEAWMLGAQVALERAARRYIDAAMVGAPPTALDVWTLGWGGEDDLPPPALDKPLFTPAECDFLVSIAPHVGKTCEVREVEEAIAALRAAQEQKPARAA